MSRFVKAMTSSYLISSGPEIWTIFPVSVDSSIDSGSCVSYSIIYSVASSSNMTSIVEFSEIKESFISVTALPVIFPLVIAAQSFLSHLMIINSFLNSNS